MDIYTDPLEEFYQEWLHQAVELVHRDPTCPIGYAFAKIAYENRAQEAWIKRTLVEEANKRSKLTLGETAFQAIQREEDEKIFEAISKIRGEPTNPSSSDMPASIPATPPHSP